MAKWPMFGGVEDPNLPKWRNVVRICFQIGSYIGLFFWFAFDKQGAFEFLPIMGFIAITTFTYTPDLRKWYSEKGIKATWINGMIAITLIVISYSKRKAFNIEKEPYYIDAVYVNDTLSNYKFLGETNDYIITRNGDSNYVFIDKSKVLYIVMHSQSK